MAEPPRPNSITLALLQDVADGKVTDDLDGTPWLNIGDDEEARVSGAIWELERAGWIDQAVGDRLWCLTDLGQTILQAGT